MVKKLVNRTEFASMAGVSGAAITKACSGKLRNTLDGKLIDINHPDAVAYLDKKDIENGPPAATGLDVLYEDAIDLCTESGRWTASQLQRGLRIGYERSTNLINTIRAAGLIPEAVNKNVPAPHPPITPVVTKPPHIRGTHAAREKKKREPPPEPGTIEIPEDIQMFADMTLRELVDKFGTDTRFVDWLSATQKIEAINEKRLKNAQTKGELISRQIVKDGVIDTFNSAHLRLLKDGAKSIAAGVISKHSGGAELSEVEAYVSDILGSFIKPVKSKITRVLKNA